MSEIRANTVSNAAGTGPATLTGQTGAKASFLYDQVANSVTASFNVSSISDDATGIFTPTFTNAFATATQFAGGASGRDTSASIVTLGIGARTATTVECRGRSTNNADTDMQENSALFHGDLA